ncbi:MAG: DUF5050 domain-containing protein, partial [Lachnospiraceae bacterium]|nr:DUF5050 domain-containing protein [Lachnospiraceae bacterium]
SKKIIYRSSPVKKENISIHYCLSDDGLFIEYKGNIYSCGFDGKNLHKIISRKKLKKQIIAIKYDALRFGGADSLKFHEGSLYLSIGYIIWKLDLKTKKITKMSKEMTFNACLCGSTLYYTYSWDRLLYKTDTSTGKSSLITKKECYALTETNGELYYVHNDNVYIYREGKKDKKVFSFGKKIKDLGEPLMILSNSGKIAVQYRKDSDYNVGKVPQSIAIYDTRTSAFNKIENIRSNSNYCHMCCLAGDMLFYTSSPGLNSQSYLSSLSYPQPARDKTFKITRKSITQPGDTESRPQENQEEKLSDKYDWDSAKITNDYDELSVLNLGNGLVLQNENYIFYPENGCKIIRINKKDKTV